MIYRGFSVSKRRICVTPLAPIRLLTPPDPPAIAGTPPPPKPALWWSAATGGSLSGAPRLPCKFSKASVIALAIRSTGPVVVTAVLRPAPEPRPPRPVVVQAGPEPGDTPAAPRPLPRPPPPADDGGDSRQARLGDARRPRGVEHDLVQLVQASSYWHGTRGGSCGCGLRWLLLRLVRGLVLRGVPPARPTVTALLRFRRPPHPPIRRSRRLHPS